MIFHKNFQYNHNFYVENGPHFTSLEHLIEYYSGHDDNSIPCPLKISITPGKMSFYF